MGECGFRRRKNITAYSGLVEERIINCSGYYYPQVEIEVGGREFGGG
jgi:hypothetical protein